MEKDKSKTKKTRIGKNEKIEKDSFVDSSQDTMRTESSLEIRNNGSSFIGGLRESFFSRTTFRNLDWSMVFCFCAASLPYLASAILLILSY